MSMHGSLRNTPCPCGSGQKTKRCCGRPAPREPLFDDCPVCQWAARHALTREVLEDGTVVEQIAPEDEDELRRVILANGGFVFPDDDDDSQDLVQTTTPFPWAS